MKMLSMMAAAAALALANPVLADDAHHPEKGQAAKTAPVAKAAAAAPELRKMQDKLGKMRQQLDRAARAKTDEARQQALAEYMQAMHESMHLARGMMDGMAACPMMQGGMMGQGMGMGMMGGGAAPAGAAERMQQMEKRIDMMQMMMEQMQKQQGMPMAPMAPKQ